MDTVKKYIPFAGMKIQIRRNSTIRMVSTNEPNELNVENRATPMECEMDFERESTVSTTTNQMHQNNNDNDYDTDNDIIINWDLDTEIEKQPEPQPKKVIMPKFAVTKSAPRPAPENKRLGLESIMPGICFPFLGDNCIEDEYCYYSHEYPSAEDLLGRLTECGVENSAKLFHVIIARTPTLLKRYYETFISFFATNKQPEHLTKTIAICEREIDQLERERKFRALIQAFIQSGLTYEATMEIILMHLTIENSLTISMVMNLKMANDVTPRKIYTIFDSLSKNPDYDFPPAVLNYVMRFCVRTKSEEFVQLLVRIFKADRRRISEVDKQLYMEYCDLYKRVVQSDSDMGSLRLPARNRLGYQQKKNFRRHSQMH